MESSRESISLNSLVHVSPPQGSTTLDADRPAVARISSFNPSQGPDEVDNQNADVNQPKIEMGLSEVGNQLEDAWIIVDGEVYDISGFLESHPGGSQVVLDHLADGDVGALMRGTDHPDSHPHSKAAFHILKQFSIGSVDALSRGQQKASRTKDKVSNTTSINEYEVDLSKPLVFQVGHLGDRYNKWVHDPIVCKESPRFFENDFLEILTTTKWWIIPLIFCPIIFLIERKALQIGHSFSSMFYWLTFGTVAWTLLEYTIHRFLFHMKTSSYWWNTVHYVLHGFHHKHPMDGTRLVFPPAFSAFFCLFIWFSGSIFIPRTILTPMYGGLLFGYVIYDLTHYYLHFGRPSLNIVRQMKRYHLNHHYKVQTNAFGITSSIWDQILGTFPVKAACQKSRLSSSHS